MKKLIVPGTPVTAMEMFEFKGSSGPNVVITGAVHGNEQTGVHAARLLIKKLEEAEILGHIKVIPVVNTTAYYHRQRVSPFDNIDMNRIFPGKEAGSLTLRTAYTLWQETQDAEYIIDLHCCGTMGSTYTLADYEGSSEIKDLCIALGMPVVCQTGGTEGQFYLDSSRKRGQKAVIIELPGGQPGGVIDMEWAGFCADALFNCLKYIKAVKGEYVEPAKTVFCGKITRTTAEKEGLFEPVAKAGDFLNEGDVIGRLTCDGEVIICTARERVRLVSVSPAKYIFVGENLFGIMPVL